MTKGLMPVVLAAMLALPAMVPSSALAEVLSAEDKVAIQQLAGDRTANKAQIKARIKQALARRLGNGDAAGLEAVLAELAGDLQGLAPGTDLGNGMIAALAVDVVETVQEMASASELPVSPQAAASLAAEAVVVASQDNPSLVSAIYSTAAARAADSTQSVGDSAAFGAAFVAAAQSPKLSGEASVAATSSAQSSGLSGTAGSSDDSGSSGVTQTADAGSSSGGSGLTGGSGLDSGFSGNGASSVPSPDSVGRVGADSASPD